jgi:hypothetical protein
MVPVGLNGNKDRKTSGGLNVSTGTAAYLTLAVSVVKKNAPQTRMFALSGAARAASTSNALP